MQKKYIRDKVVNYYILVDNFISRIVNILMKCIDTIIISNYVRVLKHVKNMIFKFEMSEIVK